MTAVAALLPAAPLHAGFYANSAHGNAAHGVNRTSTAALGYVRGNCAHCHEMEGSITGSEPAPAGGGPSPSALFYDNNVSQTDNVCLQCHTDAGSYQSGSIVNRSYSYRAGGWTTDPVDDSKQSFSFANLTNPSTGTAHSLNDILTFIKTQTWGYSDTSNPCVACHNPHAVQGDPATAGNSTKSSGGRGTPISLPSLHTAASGSWGLWGDVASETMSTYTTYQAPYRYNSNVVFEPRGSSAAATAAADSTDYVVFCTNCHNATNLIFSTTLGRNLRTINWDSEKHGKGTASQTNADGNDDLLLPYSSGSIGSYVLSCLDCHEPHGSTNAYLLRPEVNGAAGVNIKTLTGDANGPTATGPPPGPDLCNKEWNYLCAKCHTRLANSDGHVHPYYLPPDINGCSFTVCHSGAGGCSTPSCGTCHYHSSTTVPGTTYSGQLF